METITSEIDEIILRAINQHGLEAMPMDLEFLDKYDLKKYYYMSIEFHMKGIPDDVLNRTLMDAVKPLTHRKHIVKLVTVYKHKGKKAIMPLLKYNEIYFKKFYKVIKNEETIGY